MAEADDPTPGATWNLRDPVDLVATGFGVGLLPLAPGTWGSLAALPAGWVIAVSAGFWGLAAAAAAAALIGLWASDVVVTHKGIDDPGPVVIDEIAGQWLVLLVAPPDWVHYAVAFLLFRFFDIVKPWPVSWADRSLTGGFGVMMDDVLAAAYAVAAMVGVALWMA